MCGLSEPGGTSSAGNWVGLTLPAGAAAESREVTDCPVGEMESPLEIIWSYPTFYLFTHWAFHAQEADLKFLKLLHSALRL